MFPYQRLRQHEEYGVGEEEEEDGDPFQRVGAVINVKPRSWYKPVRLRAVPIRKRFRLKVPRLRRFLWRKKIKAVSALRVSCAKVLKRLKESQAHFGDIFAGNYLFLQVNPVSMKTIQESCQANQLKLQGLPSTFSLSRVA